MAACIFLDIFCRISYTYIRQKSNIRQAKKKWGGSLKRLPDAELELMLIIWEADSPVTRAEIEEKMDDSRDVLPNTVLALLSRLEKRGFVKKERDGKINHYSVLVEREPYMKEASKGILNQMFHGSLKILLLLFMTERNSVRKMRQS